jgi:hypothetical protein
MRVFLSLARGGRFVPREHNSRDFKAVRPPKKYFCQSFFDELVKDGRLRPPKPINFAAS